MKKQAVVIDIDNTIVDTAVRKHSILKEMFQQGDQTVELETIRTDYHLNTVLGEGETEERKAFLRTLCSSRGIREYSAPAFDGVVDALQALHDQGYVIILQTARPEEFREVTLEELKGLGIPFKDDLLYMAPDTILGETDELKQEQLYKESVINKILKKYDVVTSIGDRPTDYQAAKSTYVPFILFNSTLPEIIIEDMKRESNVGFFVHHNWTEIESNIEEIAQSIHSLVTLRDTFSEQYASWLGQLDTKCGILIALAGSLTALSGAILVTKLSEISSDLELIDKSSLALTGLAVISSLIAMLFGIRGYTSRKTSGREAGAQISVKLKQAFAILFGAPKQWAYRKGDAEHQFRQVRDSSISTQSRAHLEFLYDRYKTYDPEAIANLRLLELRAANYQKVYAERVGSKFAILGIVLLFLWLSVQALDAII